MSEFMDKLIDLGIRPMGSETFQPFTDMELKHIEDKIAGNVPADYRDFLSRFGCSTFATLVNCTPSEEPLYFGWFFSYEELIQAIDGLKESLPETIIPIAEDGGGNAFCLGVKGRDTGKVYYHNHGFGWHADAEAYLERGEPVPLNIRHQTVHQVASSFEEFIRNMKGEGHGDVGHGSASSTPQELC